MKLRNKKTGEVVKVNNFNGFVHLDDETKIYSSLAELNEEWEDYEEPKVIYYLLWDGTIASSCDVDGWSKAKSIGNYFGTKAEAEKVLEKLKAWKRLKDKGFRITLHGCKGNAWLEANWGNLQGDYSDILLLFGGEE